MPQAWRPVGALIRGFRTYDPEVHVAGVILNRLGSAGHARYLEPAIAREGVEILGYLPKDADLTIPNGISGCCQRLRRIASHRSWGT